jgi:putative transposase
VFPSSRACPDSHRWTSRRRPTLLRRYPKNRKARSTPPRLPRGPRRPDDTDRTDDAWARVAPSLSAQRSDTDRREVVHALLSRLRTGSAWRLLPHDFPPAGTVADSSRMGPRDGSIDRAHDALRRQVRVAAGRDPEPRAGGLESPSVQTTEQGGVKGFDAGQKVTGRKRHRRVDTMGRIVAVGVHAAGVHDDDGANPVRAGARAGSPRVQRLWADGASERRGWPAGVSSECGGALEVVKRSDEAMGVVVQRQRGVVERTFAGLGRSRRLSTDDERLTKTSETMIQISMIHIMVRRLGETPQIA